MRLNRFIALTAIALLVVGVMSALSMNVFAQSNTQTQNCDQQDSNSTATQDAPDTDTIDQQCDGQNDTSDSQVESADGQDAAPTGAPAITSAAAQKTAEAYLKAGAAIKVKLEDDNGKLIYTVEFSNNTDVKVDAMTGEVLGTEPTED